MRDAEDFEPVEVEEVECIHETDEALKCRRDTQIAWIPKSQIDDDSEVYEKGDEGTLVIPRWLAVEKFGDDFAA